MPKNGLSLSLGLLIFIYRYEKEKPTRVKRDRGAGKQICGFILWTHGSCCYCSIGIIVRSFPNNILPFVCHLSLKKCVKNDQEEESPASRQCSFSQRKWNNRVLAASRVE